MHLGWEVPVQRADRDVGAFGNGTHLNRLISTLRGDSQCGIEDALATLSLSLRTEFGLGQGGHRQHLRLTWVARRAGTGLRWRRHAVSGSFCSSYWSKRYARGLQTSPLRIARDCACPAATRTGLTTGPRTIRTRSEEHT